MAKLRREGPALAAAIVVVLAAWAPVIAGARSVCHYDLFHEHVPFRAFVQASLEQGELPLWAPGMRAGYPLHANGEAALFSPLEAPLRLAKLPAYRECDATFVLASLLATGFAYALGRALRLRRSAAILVAIAYGISGKLVAATWPNAAVVAALAPALLVAVEGMRRDPRSLLPVAGFALALGGSLLAGRPQNVAPAVALALAWSLGGGVAARWKPLVLGLGLGLGIGAPQTLPTLAYLETSSRAHGLSAEEQTVGSLTASDVPLVVAPVGARSRWPEPRAHVGLVTLLLALAAVRRRRAAALVAASVLAVLIALGPATPIFGAISWLPFVRSLRVPARFLLVASLALSVAGGIGLDALVPRRSLRVLLVLLVAGELVVGAWRTIPWANPAVYTTTPRAVEALRALPRDASGAAARFIGRDMFQGGDLVGLEDGQAVELLDAMGGDRALGFGLSSAWGYGEPVAAWQERFLAELTPRRLETLGVQALVEGVPALVKPRGATVLPRALVVATATPAASAEEAQLLLEKVDPRTTVVLEDVPELGAQPSFEATPGRITLQGANRVEVEATAPRDGWLVLFDAWDEDWRATVNGQDAPVFRAFGFFRAVRVPAGPSRVAFVYRPVALSTGLVVAAVSGLGILLTLMRCAWCRYSQSRE